jgi:hypothetical protein
MAKLQELQKDAFGFIMNFKTNTNMETTTSLLVRIRKQGSNEVTEHHLNASAIVDIPTGSVNFVVEDGDLDTLGNTKIQIVDDTPGRYIPSSIAHFKVVSNV